MEKRRVNIAGSSLWGWKLGLWGKNRAGPMGPWGLVMSPPIQRDPKSTWYLDFKSTSFKAVDKGKARASTCSDAPWERLATWVLPYDSVPQKHRPPDISCWISKARKIFSWQISWQKTDETSCEMSSKEGKEAISKPAQRHPRVTEEQPRGAGSASKEKPQSVTSLKIKPPLTDAAVTARNNQIPPKGFV